MRLSQTTDRIRVAYVIDTLMIGGTEFNAIRTLEALDRERFEVTVFHCANEGPLRERYEALGVRMHFVPLSGFRSLKTLWRAVRFGWMIRSMGIKVVHCHDVYTNIFAVPWARMLGRGGVIASRRWFFDVPRPELNRLNRWSYRFAHRVLANSASVARLLVDQEGVPAAKIVEIPNFLSDQAFEVETADRRQAQRKEWGVPHGAFVVGSVGRLAAVKNHAMLLRAFSLMQPDTHLVLIGDGPERDTLRSLAVELGVAARVHLLGAMISPLNLHQYFDISVLSSLSEGFPNSIIEALAAARPVVATRVGGVGDVVEHGVTGLLVASEDTQALAAALAQLQADVALRCRLGEAGMRCVRERYSQRTVISKLEDLYTELARGVR